MPKQSVHAMTMKIIEEAITYIFVFSGLPGEISDNSAASIAMQTVKIATYFNVAFLLFRISQI